MCSYVLPSEFCWLTRAMVVRFLCYNFLAIIILIYYYYYSATLEMVLPFLQTVNFIRELDGCLRNILERCNYLLREDDNNAAYSKYPLHISSFSIQLFMQYLIVLFCYVFR